MDQKLLDFFQIAIAKMREGGIHFEAGLTDAEVERAEQTYGFRFPPDLRAFLQIALPVSDDYRKTIDGRWITTFPNWRDYSPQSVENIHTRLNWPAYGICWDIENQRNSWWLDWWIPIWGKRPDRLEDALELARQKLLEVPKLIPIHVHAFMPAEPYESGNPIFSVSQSDIIHFGYDLTSYLHHRFNKEGVPLPEWAAKTPKYIPFWSDFDPSAAEMPF